MSKHITLAKAAQVPAGGPIRPAGYSADVDDEFYEALKARGVLVDDEPDVTDAVEEFEPVDAVEPQEPVIETADAEVEPEVKPARKGEPLRRPPGTASVAELKEYAAQFNINTSGMKKAEILGALDALAE